ARKEERGGRDEFRRSAEDSAEPGQEAHPIPTWPGPRQPRRRRPRARRFQLEVAEPVGRDQRQARPGSKSRDGAPSRERGEDSRGSRTRSATRSQRRRAKYKAPV